MHILFISSSLPSGEPSPIIASQADSIRALGCDIEYYTLKEKGLKGYLREIFILRKFLQKNKFDIYHAHYGLSAIVATLAGAKPLVVSLMGSDVKEGGWQKWLIKKFVKERWKKTIAKSKELAELVGTAYCETIPNGVDFDEFKPLSLELSRPKLSLHENKTYVLFGSNPERPEKNVELAKKAIELIGDDDIELIYLKDVVHADVPLWLNAANVVVLSSLWEGSPNVIKEAMACNRPIVSTLVGDVEWLFGSEPGHFIAGFDAHDYASKLQLALAYAQEHGSTKGGERIIQLGLDSKTVASKIISIYKKVINNNEYLPR